ncbi:fumarylacetoacetate hydrolase family protein [Pseudalkalibacillus sp. SCS-8]|uniref:fumarylacetoacetate hydrolase family protein n=1 Tax=Pseudalkalibacillus nanhaiensis TaxID=3115291 RepID=UPI0032DB3769
MKFLTAVYRNETMIGLLREDEQVVNLTGAASELGIPFPVTLLEGIQQGENFLEQTRQLVEQLNNQDLQNNFTLSVHDIDFLAPIPRPTKNIFCVGKNYREHALELGDESDIPEVPMIFSKAPTSVIGTNETIRIPTEVTTEIDYEGELAVVIGKTGKRIKKESAYDHVFGYTLINDITARDLQSRHKQFLIGKSLDTSCPMGPVIVHKSAIQDPQKLSITTHVNGERRQQSSTEMMIFSIADLIEDLSKVMTLEAGDIIATGTPAGVGKGFKPPKYLKAGDVVSVEVESIGILKNPVQNEV